MATLAYSDQLVIEECHCGIMHAIPSNLARRAQQEGIQVYCPLGHAWVVRETDNKRLKRDLEEAQRQRDAARIARDAAQDQAAAAERRRAAAKGQLTKVKRRVAHGVCPCCNRTFADLARHMETKHPTYAVGDAQP